MGCCCCCCKSILLLISLVIYLSTLFVGKSASTSSSFELLLHIRHLQQTMHGAANKRSGEATNNNIPKPAKIPITCARCHITDAREWPNLFLHGPLS